MSATENGRQRSTVWGAFKDAFMRGLAVMVPVVITAWVLNLLFNAVDGIISPLFVELLGRYVPGLGFISMIVLILIVGGLSRNFIGKVVFKFFERVIFAIPLARTIYSAMKDLIGAFGLGSKSRTFRQVVLVEYPRVGLFTIGFVTNSISVGSLQSGREEMVSVYLPHPPNPTSGVMILLPKVSVQVLRLTVEEGLKLVLSGGIVSPAVLDIEERSIT